MKRLLLVLFVSIFPAESYSDEAISLEEATAYALSKSPAVKEIDSAFADTLKDALETGTLKNPELDGLIKSPKSRGGESPDDEIEVLLSQPLRISDFGSRSKLSRLMEESSTLNQKLSLVELSQKIKLIYTRAWALEERMKLFNDGKKRADEFSKSISKSAVSGLVGRGQALAFEAEVKKIEADLLGAEGDLAQARRDLTALIGRTIQGKALTKPQFSNLPDSGFLHSRASDPSFPPNARAELRLKIAKAQQDVASEDSFPNLVPKLFYGKNSDGFDEYGGGISIEIPLWYQNEGALRSSSAQGELHSATREYLTGSGFLDELSSSLRFAAQSTKQATMYEREVVPKLRESLTELIKQYQGGSASVFEILQSQRELLQGESEALELYVKAMGAEVDLAILNGAVF